MSLNSGDARILSQSNRIRKGNKRIKSKSEKKKKSVVAPLKEDADLYTEIPKDVTELSG